MIYQYIHGRLDDGYGTIKNTDRGKYTNDKTLINSLIVNLEPPDKGEIPEPMVFVNTQDISAVGRFHFVEGGRGSVLYHYYLFDGNNKNKLYEDFRQIFEPRYYTKDVIEAKTVLEEIPNFSGVPEIPSSKIFLNFKISPKMFKNIIYACFNSASSNHQIYFISDDCSKSGTDNKLLIIELLFSLMPYKILHKLGFITYFKYISPPVTETLNSNIRIRFVENNTKNLSEIKSIESKGHFVFDLSNGYFTDNKIETNAFLDFILENINNPNTILKSFYTYVDKNIYDYNNIDFDFLSNMYILWSISKESKSINSDIIYNLIPYYNIVSDDRLKSFLISALNTNLAVERKSKSSDLDSYLLNLYNNIFDFREIIINHYAELFIETFEKQAIINLDVLNNSLTIKEFTNHFYKKILTDSKYNKAGIQMLEFFIKEIMAKETEPTEKLDEINSMFKFYSDIADDIFKRIDLSFYIDKYIFGLLENIDMEQFNDYIYDLEEIASQIKSPYSKSKFEDYVTANYREFAYIYIDKHIEYDDAKAVVDEVMAFDKKIKTKSLFYTTNFNNFLSDILYDFFNPVISSDNLLELFKFLRYTDSLDAEGIDDICELLISKLFNPKLSVPNEIMDEILTWPDKYIKMISKYNDKLNTKLYNKRKIQEFSRYFETNDYKKIKDFIISLDYEIYKNDIIELLDRWIVKNKNNPDFDYTVLPFVFNKQLAFIFDYLPKNNITPLVECVKIIKSENIMIPNDFQIYLENFINRNKKILTEYKNLSKDDKDFIGPIKTNKTVKSEKGKFIRFILIAVLIYILEIIFSTSINLKTATAIAIINGVLSLIYIFVAVYTEINKNKGDEFKPSMQTFAITCFILFNLIISMVVIPFDKPNSDNVVVKAYKTMFFIKNDIVPPEIFITNITKSYEEDTSYITDFVSPIKIHNENKINITFESKDDSGIAENIVKINGDPISILDNTIEINASNYPLGRNIVQITTKDTFNNRTLREFVFEIEKLVLPKITKFTVATIKTTPENGVVTNNFEENGVITLSPNESLQILTKIISDEKAKIDVLINEADVFYPKETPEDYVFTINKELLKQGENKLKITAEIPKDKKTIEIIVNLIEQ